MKLKFMLDYNCNPLWSYDEETIQKYGYQVDDLAELGLSENTISLSNHLIEIFNTLLNPIYQDFPSFWSKVMCNYFNQQVKNLFAEINNEIGTKFEIVNLVKDIEPDNLKEFLENPAKYCTENNIHFKEVNELIEEVRIAYNKHLEFERQILKDNFLLDHDIKDI